MPEIRIIEAKTPDQKKLRVAAYCRVSSDSADQLASYLNQVSRYTEFIEQNPEWVLADIYADEGLTGTRVDTRRDFQRMMRDCERGKIDRILVKSISRFARNTQDCLTTVRQLKLLGVSVYFEKEKLDTAGRGGEMFLSMYSAGAQQESVSISQNQRWSYKRRMERGDCISYRAPYGYRFKYGTLHIHEPEAEVVRRIFREYLSGKSKQQIVDGLDSDKIFRDVPWRVGYISSMLTNEKYAGEAILQKKYTTDTLPFKLVTNHGEKQKYHIQNSHPAIISLNDFKKARELAAGRDFAKSQTISYTFSRRIRCAHCGKAFKRRVQNDKVSWTCYAHHQKAELCPTPPICEQDIQSAFVRMWNKLLHNRKYILNPLLSDLRELREKTAIGSAMLSKLNLQIAELAEQNLILSQVRSKGYLDSAIFTQQSDEISLKLNALRAERRVLLKQDEDNPVLEGIQSLCDIMDKAAPLAEFDDAAFISVADNIIIDRDKRLRFRLKGGLELCEFPGEVSVNND